MVMIGQEVKKLKVCCPLTWLCWYILDLNSYSIGFKTKKALILDWPIQEMPHTCHTHKLNYLQSVVLFFFLLPLMISHLDHWQTKFDYFFACTTPASAQTEAVPAATTWNAW
jgi:hypothetical protein